MTTSAELVRGVVSQVESRVSSQIEETDWEFLSEPALLIMNAASDVAGFAVATEDLREDYEQTYGEFKRLYVNKKREWGNKNLSFIVLRTDGETNLDSTAREIESDEFFCRKYVLRWFDDESRFDEEVSRLPFFPINPSSLSTVLDQVPAKSLLDAMGMKSALSSEIAYPGRRKPEGIVDRCLNGQYGEMEINPTAVPPRMQIIDAESSTVRFEELALSDFRAYAGKHSFALDGDVVLVYGPNGLGKTSLFDAVDFLCTGSIARFDKTKAFGRVASNLGAKPDSIPGVEASIRIDGDVKNFLRTVDERTKVNAENESLTTKDFLGRLTSVPSSETRAHVAYLIRAWRATHYFAQGFQEFFSEFESKSELPADLMSKMFAIQDYVDAINKLSAILKELEARISREEIEIQGSRERLDELSERRDEWSDESQSTLDVQSIEERVRDIARELSTDLGVDVSDDIDLATQLRSIRSVIAGEIAQRTNKVEGLEVLLPSISLRDEDEAVAQDLSLQIEDAENELKDLENDRADFQARSRELESLRLSESENLDQLSSRVDALNWIALAAPEYDSLTEAVVEAEKNRSELQLGISGLQEQRIALTEDLQQIELDRITVEAESQNHREALSNLERISSRLSDWEQISKNLDEVSAEVLELESRRGSLLALFDERSKELDEANSVYRDAVDQLAQQEQDQERLLAILEEAQSFIEGGLCPVCGTDHSADEALVARIEEQKERARQSASAQLSITEENRDRVNSLQVLVEDQQRELDSLASELSEAEERRNRLQADLDAAQQAWLEAGLSGDFDNRQIAQEVERLNKSLETLQGRTTALDADRTEKNDAMSLVDESISRETDRADQLVDTITSARARLTTLENESASRNISFADPDKTSSEELLAAIEDKRATLETLAEELQTLSSSRERIGSQVSEKEESIGQLKDRLNRIRNRMQEVARELSALRMSPDETHSNIESEIKRLSDQLASLRRLESDVLKTEVSYDEAQNSAFVSSLAKEHEAVTIRLSETERRLSDLKHWHDVFSNVQKRLSGERHDAVARYIDVLGPIASVIQGRLRSVYGFGPLKFEASRNSVKVTVRHGSRDVPPNDYFSDSERQILMLSIFLASTVSQRWSGFLPVLLDDPVTHLDGLNEYAFADLLRAVVEDQNLNRQIIVSTCDDQLFALLRQKLGDIKGRRVVAHEFQTIGKDGPRFKTEYLSSGITTH